MVRYRQEPFGTVGSKSQNCSDWIAFSNPRHFSEPYRRQKGWEKPDNNEDAKATMKDKIKRLMENDVKASQYTT